MKQLITSLLLICSVSLYAQNVTGLWKTIDDKTNKPKSIVEVYEQNGKLYGKIIKLINEDPNYDPICDKCNDHRKNKKVKGMIIIDGLTKQGKTWDGKSGILDPKNGKIYDVKLWREGDELKVRGYIAFIYRTQTWIKVSE